jgi:hypothetical protein
VLEDPADEGSEVLEDLADGGGSLDSRGGYFGITGPYALPRA